MKNINELFPNEMTIEISDIEKDIVLQESFCYISLKCGTSLTIYSKVMISEEFKDSAINYRDSIESSTTYEELKMIADLINNAKE